MQYEIGDEIPFTINWLTQTGEEAVVTGTPTASLKKYNAITDTWDTVFAAQNMTQIGTTSTWTYTWDSTSSTVNTDYLVVYNAVIDTLDIVANEQFRLVESINTDDLVTKTYFDSGKGDILTAISDSESNISDKIDLLETSILNQIKELRRGNERVVFSYDINGIAESVEIQTKADGDVDWSSPVSTKTLYFTYDVNGKLTKVGEA